MQKFARSRGSPDHTGASDRHLLIRRGDARQEVEGLMPSTGGPSSGLLIATLVVSLVVGAGVGWAVRKVPWWVLLLLAAVVIGGGATIAGGLTYSTADQAAGPAAVQRLVAAGLVTAGVVVGVTALVASWFLCHRSVRRAAAATQRRRAGGAAPQARRRPPVVVAAGSGYIPRGTVVKREKP